VCCQTVFHETERCNCCTCSQDLFLCHPAGGARGPEPFCASEKVLKETCLALWTQAEADSLNALVLVCCSDVT